MTRSSPIVVAGLLVCGLLLAGAALAMESDNYQLDWFTPLTSGGGGLATSTNYVVNLTVGQSAVGASSSTSYGGCLGYWCGTAAVHRVYLPLILRSFS
jgi:hypothetical protein